MFGRLFGRDKSPAPARQASQAWDIWAGGFLKFGLLAPEGLEEADIEVRAVHALHLGPGKVRRVLEGASSGKIGDVALWRDEADRLAVARAVFPDDVKALFGGKAFGRLFESENVSLARRREPEGFRGWTGSRYRQEAGHEAYRHDCDPALVEVGEEETGAFDFYRLVSDDREHALEAFVHDGGRTEVFIIALLELRRIEGFWAGR